MSKVGMRYQQWAFMCLDSETLKRILLGLAQWMPRAIISHELGDISVHIHSCHLLVHIYNLGGLSKHFCRKLHLPYIILRKLFFCRVVKSK